MSETHPLGLYPSKYISTAVTRMALPIHNAYCFQKLKYEIVNVIYQYPLLLMPITHIPLTHQLKKKRIHTNIQEPESDL